METYVDSLAKFQYNHLKLGSYTEGFHIIPS